MIVIPAVNVGTVGEPLLMPSAPFPRDFVQANFDGTNYTVYQAGDTLPDAPQE